MFFNVLITFVHLILCRQHLSVQTTLEWTQTDGLKWGPEVVSAHGKFGEEEDRQRILCFSMQSARSLLGLSRASLVARAL